MLMPHPLLCLNNCVVVVGGVGVGVAVGVVVGTVVVMPVTGAQRLLQMPRDCYGQ